MPTPSGRLPWRVLIVDSDTSEIAARLASSMQSSEVEFRLASDRASAWQTAAEFMPQMAVFDLGLPRLEGFLLARQIRQSDLLRTTWLVAGSTFGDVAYRTLAKDAGFDDFVLKPYTVARWQGLFERMPRAQANLP